MSNKEFKNPVIKWIDYRLPIFTLLRHEFDEYPTPKNFNYLWNFGAIATFILAVMILTGVVMSAHYTPHADMAFNSVERIMRDVNYGWLLRYVHANGASMFFIAVYIHIFRGLYYGSYKKPRELLWMLGVVILLLMMATAFMGYVLPWGQMSFWGATVITNLFSAVPLVGEDIVQWMWGGFSIANPTLNRFFSMHYLLPFVICAVVFLHIWALHVHGSNNPLGIEPKGKQDTIPFHPYYTMKDGFGLSVFLIFYAAMTFFFPDYFGHPDNYIPANPLSTPPHIVPEWYFLPFYAILRAVPDIGAFGIVLIEAKLAGVLAMFASIFVLFVLPWLDGSPIRSASFRPIYKKLIWVFVVACGLLGYAGAQPAEGMWLIIARICTLYYFAHFLVVLPLLAKYEKPLALPKSIHDAVLQKAKKMAVILVVGLAITSPAMAAGGETPAPAQEWSFGGMFGTYDRASAQRGFQVYREVCSSCHGLDQLYYRNLSMLGFPEAEIKALAAEYEVTDGPNDQGDMFQRSALPSDRIVNPFPNQMAARASNGGALPPDLSLITKARADGPNYLYGLLTGYGEPEHGMAIMPGMYYNQYFPGHQIAMAPPLSEGMVSYQDETDASVDQMARDVVTFLAWAADPHMEARKQMGVRVLIYLILLAIVMYFVKRRVWANIKH